MDWNFAAFGVTKVPPPPPPPLANNDKSFLVNGEVVQVPFIRDKLYTTAKTKKAPTMSLNNGGSGYVK